MRRPKADALQLTIDYDLQKAAEDGFRQRRLQRRRADHGSADG